MKEQDLELGHEQERLFGDESDLFKKYYAVKFIANILRTIGLQEIGDDDFYRTAALYLTMDEVARVYDRIFPPEARESKANSRKFDMTPPELSGNDSPSECLEYLGRNTVRRKKMWGLLLAIFEKRAAEYEKALNAEHTPSAMEARFLEMKKLFDLSGKEMETLLAIFFSMTGALRLGDFDLSRYRQCAKISSLAKTVGLPEFELAGLLNEDHCIGRFGLVDKECELDDTFLSYLSGISSKPLSERFWTKYSGEVLPWNFHGKLAEKHGTVLMDMIRRKKASDGISVLLFGVAGSGKTSFAASLASALGKELYFIAQNDDDKRQCRTVPRSAMLRSLRRRSSWIRRSAFSRSMNATRWLRTQNSAAAFSRISAWGSRPVPGTASAKVSSMM